MLFLIYIRIFIVSSHRLVDILSTHLGAFDDEHDLQCLVLLTCIARDLDYSNVGFIMNYYYRLADNEEVSTTCLNTISGKQCCRTTE